MIPRLPKGFSHPMTIGEGSFSSVCRVRQKILDRWVAMKIIHEKNGDRRQEVLNEARNQAQMSISCIPAVYDAFSQGPHVFIVMEWIKGASLQSLLAKGIPHEEDRAALAFSMIAALAGLHKLGFAHRDFKPANILVSADSSVFLVDFGFSRKIGEAGHSGAGQVKGTPAYMAPEIWQGGKEIDFRKADLFALGKVLQELAPGKEWESLIQPLLSLNPGGRPASADEVWENCRALPAARMTAGWKASISGMSSELLSHRLLQAAKQLLFEGRGDEAYWLLAECLQENPDSTEALRLLENFPALSKEKARKRLMLGMAAAAAITLALVGAFHFGKRSERDNWYQAVNTEKAARQLLLPAPTGMNKAPLTTARFREFTRVGSRLAGVLFVEGSETCDSLFLDGQNLMMPLAPEGIPLEAGEHSLVCADRDGTLVYREKITMLPYLRKLMRLGAKTLATAPKKEA